MFSLQSAAVMHSCTSWKKESLGCEPVVYFCNTYFLFPVGSGRMWPLSEKSQREKRLFSSVGSWSCSAALIHPSRCSVLISSVLLFPSKKQNKTWKWMSSSHITFILIWYQIMPVYKPKSFAVRCTHSKQLPKTKTIPLFVHSVLSKAISSLCKSNEQKSEMP